MPMPHTMKPSWLIIAVGEHAAQIVLDHGEEDREHGHRRADVDQQLGAGEAARQRVDRDLGGEGAEEHRAGRRRLRIGVGQPVVQERERRT